MSVCCECCVLSGRGLCDGLITRPEESYQLWRVVVCDQETSKTRWLKPATGLWKIQPRWVVTPGKQIVRRSSHKDSNRERTKFSIIFVLASQYRSKCKVDPLPSGAPWATLLTAKWSTTLQERPNQSISKLETFLYFVGIMQSSLRPK
jgi:hypothetical protein